MNLSCSCLPNGAALDLPGSLIARTRSKCKLDIAFVTVALIVEIGALTLIFRL